MRKFLEQEIVRRNKVEEFKKNSIESWVGKKETTHNLSEVNSAFNSFTKLELEELKKEVSLYGRIMAKRGPFIKILQGDFELQLYINKKERKKEWDFLEKLDIGDIIWAKGIVMKTMTSEIALNVIEVQLLSKSLKVLPEKYHGLKDVEERYRNRYVDLIINKESRRIFITRTLIFNEIRNFFNSRNFLEADTPILSPTASGASASPFISHHNALNRDYYLRIATELPLKKLIVGGLERVYEIGRLFRNEGVDTTHNPEFTTIEFYEANKDLWDMMDYTEELIKSIAKKLEMKSIEFRNHKIDLFSDFKKVEMSEIVSEKLGIDVKKATKETLINEAIKRKFKVEKFFEIGHLINLFFEELVEETLIQPTFVYGHPIEISPFAKISNDPRFTERAELFIATKEYANMYSELSDPIDQLKRFEEQQREKKQGNDEANDIDWDFINALEYGMPPAGGCGIGIDRLVMLMTGKNSIREVLLFPHLKEKGDKNE